MILSLFGDRDSHERQTGKIGIFDNIRESICRLAKDRKRMRLILNCVINPDNINDLAATARLGKELGVDRVRYENLIFLTPAELKVHEQFCSKFENPFEWKTVTNIQAVPTGIAERVPKIVAELKREYGSFVSFKPLLESDEFRDWYREGFRSRRFCSFVRHSIFIKSNGDVIPCQFFPHYRLGNILEQGLEEIWDSDKRKRFNEQLKTGLMPACVRCCKL